MKTVNLVEIEGKRYIVVDNEAFDWELDPEQFKSIEFKIRNDPSMKDSFIGNIFNHLTSCFSEFIGRKVSLKEINDAIEKGFI